VRAAVAVENFLHPAHPAHPAIARHFAVSDCGSSWLMRCRRCSAGWLVAKEAKPLTQSEAGIGRALLARFTITDGDGRPVDPLALEEAIRQELAKQKKARRSDSRSPLVAVLEHAEKHEVF
jgi:hypothetical protein